jgi:secretion/DNA translocation related CpaE-like protein
MTSDGVLWPVIAVVGGSGGVGASTFAAFLALVAGRRFAPRSVLIDLDPAGGGVDVLLGAESVPGSRWSALRLGGGRLDPQAFADGLPAWSSVSVLAADGSDLPPPAAVDQALDIATRVGPVIVDTSRFASPTRSTVLARGDLAVLVAASHVYGVTGGRTAASALRGRPAGVVVRAARGGPIPSRAAELIGLRLIGVLPSLRRPGRDRPLGTAAPRSVERLATGVLAGVLR